MQPSSAVGDECGVRKGVGAFPDGGRNGPNPKLLCGDRLATDGIWASSRQHPIYGLSSNKLPLGCQAR
jgi:hypothetical protein